MAARADILQASGHSRGGGYVTAGKIDRLTVLVYSAEPLREGQRVEVEQVNGRYEARP